MRRWLERAAFSLVATFALTAAIPVAAQPQPSSEAEPAPAPAAQPEALVAEQPQPAPEPAVPAASSQSEVQEPKREPPAESSAHAGMFLPLTMAPRTDSQHAFVRVASGYDSIRRSAVFDGIVDVTLWGPIALRAGVDYGERTEGRARPSGGLRVQALKQERHGIDMGVGVFYRPEGFTEPEGEIEAVVSFGRRIQRWAMFANLVYGQDPEARERDGEVKLAALYDLTLRAQLGLDARARFDLGTEEGKLEKEGGEEFDFIVGPAFSYALGYVAFVANAGLRGAAGNGFQAGFIGLAGLGGSL